MLAIPTYRLPGAPKPKRNHVDLWSVAEALHLYEVGDITGYDRRNRMLLTTGRDPIRFEKFGGVVPASDLEILQDHLASFRY